MKQRFLALTLSQMLCNHFVEEKFLCERNGRRLFRTVFEYDGRYYYTIVQELIVSGQDCKELLYDDEGFVECEEVVKVQKTTFEYVTYNELQHSHGELKRVECDKK